MCSLPLSMRIVLDEILCWLLITMHDFMLQFLSIYKKLMLIIWLKEIFAHFFVHDLVDALLTSSGKKTHRCRFFPPFFNYYLRWFINWKNYREGNKNLTLLGRSLAQVFTSMASSEVMQRVEQNVFGNDYCGKKQGVSLPTSAKELHWEKIWQCHVQVEAHESLELLLIYRFFVEL